MWRRSCSHCSSKVEGEAKVTLGGAVCINANLTNGVFSRCVSIFAKIRTELETATSRVDLNWSKCTSNFLNFLGLLL